MTMWLEDLDCKALKLMARQSTSMYIASKPDGTILWANRSFLDWSKYTLHELLSKTWQELSVNDGNLEADRKELESLNEYEPTYSVQKSYIPKGSAPQLGMLHVTKYPPTGPIQFCWCRWEPFYNGTAKAFESSLKAQNEFTSALNQLATQVKIMTDKTVEEKAFSSVIGLAQKYPKIAWVLFGIVLTTFIGNNTTSILQKLGYFGPESVQVVNTLPQGK